MIALRKPRPRRFAWYASTTATRSRRLTPALELQRRICAAIADESGGVIASEFVDYEGTYKADLLRLIDEAKDDSTRRFDTVIAYFPSSLDPSPTAATDFEQRITATGVDVVFVAANLLGAHSQAGRS